ncbi:MAG: dihydrodipicolinate reductase [Candidatus Syntrophoarchaeum caldarius]|uniref:4-hydroxy-tetrahydrodipicolinate reductase n=1 Tax=Candidatus Syntropharchaeum caldarium TaxID=1838285 RepID=A0A1F2PB46_9EURY|nr:MAG: dihydrodipicolinate reductase [Candidatus Syntrophoarchaeum caldarius]
MIRVAVSGANGRMGRLIVERIKQEEGIETVAAFDLVGEGVSHPDRMSEVLSERDVDVLVDFTIADAVRLNAITAAEAGVNLVIGTTGMSDEDLEAIRSEIKDKVAAVISPNFSIGVNLLWRLIKDAADMLDGYDIAIIEAHHRTKLDAPSGTALRAAGLLQEMGKHVDLHAIRGGDIVGDHTVLFSGIGERLEITHRAHSRDAFVNGVIRAIRWVNRREQGIYSMDDVMESTTR